MSRPFGFLDPCDDYVSISYNPVDIEDRRPDITLRLVKGDVRLKQSFALLSCYYCALTWVFFDYVLTFHDEVAYVWKRPTRVGSYLFYVLRYLGIVSLIAGSAIHAWPEKEYTGMDTNPCPYPNVTVHKFLWSKAEEITFQVVPALQFSVFWAVELLQSRIFALYGNDRRIAIFNGVLFAFEIAAMIGLWYHLPATCYGDLSNSDLMGGISLECNQFALYWLPGIGFELWLAVLACVKLRPQVLKHDLLSVMVHDSIRYFFLIAIAMVAHIITALKGFGDNAIPFVIAGVTIGGSRLVLHLRRAYFRGHDASLSDISMAIRTINVPMPNGRFVDETFYVQENLSDDEFSDPEDEL